MNASIPDPEHLCEPTLERIPRDDPDAPPLFELRAEYAIDPSDAPCTLRGTFARAAARSGDLLLSAIYFLGLSVFAPLIRSRDPFNLAADKNRRWSAPSVAQPRARIAARG